jgi:hypothetical protein
MGDGGGGFGCDEFGVFEFVLGGVGGELGWVWVEVCFLCGFGSQTMSSPRWLCLMFALIFVAVRRWREHLRGQGV